MPKAMAQLGGEPLKSLDHTNCSMLVMPEINWAGRACTGSLSTGIAVAPTLAKGVTPDIVREKFNIYHPLSTSVSIDPECGSRLIKHLTENFGSAD